MKKNISLSLLFLLCSCALEAIAPLNIFRPYDVLLTPLQRPGARFQWDVAYEASVRTRAFQEIIDDKCRDFRRTVETMQLWQCSQNAFGALHGIPPTANNGLSELFRQDNDDHEFGHYLLDADLHVHNLMLSGRWYLPHNVTIGLHVPFIIMSLDNLCVRQKTSDVLFGSTDESVLLNNFLGAVLSSADISWRDWRRAGVGDVAFMVAWGRNHPQARPLLKNVRTELRLGLTFPTGLKTDQDLLLALPFGGDGTLGIVFGGTLDVWLTYALRLGVDAELWQVFPSTRVRRVRTQVTQTEFLFPVKLPTYEHFGVLQKFTLYAEYGRILPGLSGKIAYQFLKQQESKVFLGSYVLSPEIANDAESLQDWTAHSLIVGAQYTWWQESNTFTPYIGGLYKCGFNGKRAIAMDSITLTIGAQF